MKKFITLLSVILCCATSANANLCHEKEYWIEEINQASALSDNDIKLRNCFIFGSNDIKMAQLYPETEVVEQSMATLFDVLKENAAAAKQVHVNFYRSSSELQRIVTKYILNGLVSNTTAEKLLFVHLDSESAPLLAKIIEKNNFVLELECKESSFDDVDAKLIANALNKNSTLQKLNMHDSKFSMTARKLIRGAWERNKVAHRKQEIEF